MKKFIKIIAVALCVTILGVMLCSCQYLDEKKANHAVYCDDTKDSFTFRDYTYRKADNPKGLSFVSANEMSDAYVTPEDVPVLLSSSFGEMLFYDISEKNPIIIQCISYNMNDYYYSNPISLSSNFNNLRMDYYKYYSSNSDRIYIREDQYDKVSNTLKNAVFDHYYMVDYHYNYDEYDYNGYSVDSEENTLIDDDAIKAINESLKTGKKIVYTDFGDDDFDALDVYQCDQDVLITNNYSVHLLNSDDGCYLVQLKDAEPISNDVVKVPDQYTGVIKKLFKDHDNIYGTKMYECFEAMKAEYYPDDSSSSGFVTGYGDSSTGEFV